MTIEHKNEERDRKTDRNRRGALVTVIIMSFVLLFVIFSSIIFFEKKPLAPADNEQPRIIASIDKSSIVISFPTMNPIQK